VNDPLLVLEFSTNMTEQAPGRLRLVTPSGASTIIAEGLPTPTSMAVDQTTGEVFITHIFPGFITRIQAAAALPASPPSAVVPVIASAPGAYDARYTTMMQISNPHPFAISGRLVVHPAGSPASAGDPSRPYVLAPFQTEGIDDLIASGIGSVDVLAAVGSVPVMVTTVIDTNSMNSLQIPAVEPADAITAGMRGTLITPAQPSRQRFNIGIRTLGEGATVDILVYDSEGMVVSSLTRGFGPNVLHQFSYADLFGTSPGANQSVAFEVLNGSAIIYGSAVENASGAMTLQLAQGLAD
jgi:hypothetical protein